MQILRRHAQILGYSGRFSIADTADQIALVRDAKDLDMDVNKFEPGDTERHQCRQNELIDPQEYADRAWDYREKIVARVYATYQERLKSNDTMDFDDLIMQTVNLLERHEDVLRFTETGCVICLWMSIKIPIMLNTAWSDSGRRGRKSVRSGRCGSVDISLSARISAISFLFLGLSERGGGQAREELPFHRNILDAANHVISHNVDRPEKTLYGQSARGSGLCQATGGRT